MWNCGSDRRRKLQNQISNEWNVLFKSTDFQSIKEIALTILNF